MPFQLVILCICLSLLCLSLLWKHLDFLFIPNIVKFHNYRIWSGSIFLNYDEYQVDILNLEIHNLSLETFLVLYNFLLPCSPSLLLFPFFLETCIFCLNGNFAMKLIVIFIECLFCARHGINSFD